jgi:hypothetical protein
MPAKKLSLRKETLTSLSSDQLTEVNGGEKPSRFACSLGPGCSRVTCPSYLVGCPGSAIGICATSGCALD